MRFRMILMRVGIASLLMGMPILSAGKTWAATTPQLVISQFKITSSNGQFVTLYNQSSSTIDLSQYEVDYVNSSNKLTSVPISGQVPAHGFYMLNDDQVRLCYQMILNSASLGFATTGGKLQIWQTSTDGATKQLQDSVTWTNKTSGGGVPLPTQNVSVASLLRQPTDSLGNPQITAPAGGTWATVMPDAATPCNLDIVNTSTPVASPSSNPGNRLGTGQAPPSTIVNLASAETPDVGPVLPSADVGLAAPQITELLPNPDGSGNDDTDEFIELYNPNPAEFHLVGFTLQTGSVTKHSYVFPDATILPAGSFTAFYAADTGLSLSNTSGQADLLDPFGNALSQTDAYGTAKDGQTWALANGAWYWTTQSTPGAANVVKQVAATHGGKSPSASKSAKAGAVKGASTTKSAASSSAAPAATEAAPSPIHPYILAAVAVLAVGYGIYEYRHDLGNRFHQLRANRATRRTARA